MVFAKTFALIMMALVFMSQMTIAGGLEAIGLGTKASGMAGAFRAIADDWTATYYNPAGLARLLDNQLGANLSLVHIRNEITPDFRWGGTFSSGVENDVAQYNHHAILSNPSAGFALRLPVWGETVFGLSAYEPFDYNVEWRLFQIPGAYNDSLQLPEKQYLNNLDVVAFQLTAAREFKEEQLYLCLGLSVLRADLLHDNVYLRRNPYLAVDPNWEFAQRPADHIVEWTQDDGYGFGFGVRGGLLWQQSDKLTVGLSAFVPSNIKVSGESVLELYMPKFVYPTKAGEQGGGVPQLLKEGSMVVDSASFDATIKLPPSIGAGAAYQVNEKLTLTLDGEYTLWSRFDGYHFDYRDHQITTALVYSRAIRSDTVVNITNYIESDLSRAADWSNSLKFMAGARYLYSENLTLLGGAGIDQSPMRSDKLFSPQFADLGTKLMLSAGLIVHIDRWDLGLVTAYSGHPNATAESLTDIDGDGVVDSFAGDYKAATYQTSLSFNYRF